MYERCEKHNLAAGPDGKCVLCQRSTAKIFVEVEEKSGWISRSFTVLLGLGTVVAIILSVYWYNNPETSPFTLDILKRDSAMRGVGPVFTPDSEQAAAGGAGGTPGNADSERSENLMTGQTEKATSAAEEVGTVGDQKEGPVDEKTRGQNQELENARRQVSVIMYATRYCPVCAEARSHMNLTGIQFLERDVDEDPDALVRRDKINPMRSVPTFEIDGEVLVGFSENKFDQVYTKAVERRLKGKASR